MTADKILTLIRGLAIIHNHHADKAATMFCNGILSRDKTMLRELGIPAYTHSPCSDRESLALAFSSAVNKFGGLDDFVKDYEKSFRFTMAKTFNGEGQRIKAAKLEIYESLGHCLDWENTSKEA